MSPGSITQRPLTRKALDLSPNPGVSKVKHGVSPRAPLDPVLASLHKTDEVQTAYSLHASRLLEGRHIGEQVAALIGRGRFPSLTSLSTGSTF